jgi:hypothetical protein
MSTNLIKLMFLSFLLSSQTHLGELRAAYAEDSTPRKTFDSAESISIKVSEYLVHIQTSYKGAYPEKEDLELDAAQVELLELFSSTEKDSFLKLTIQLNETPRKQGNILFLGSIDISHKPLQTMYDCRCEMIAKANGGNANAKILLHVTKPGFLTSICSDGFDVTKCQGGLFGKGLYFSESPDKVNDYNHYRGANKLRLMLQTECALGKVCDFGVGRFDKALSCAPNKSHSVKGFVRNDAEYVVYDATQTCPRKILFYAVEDVKKEMEPNTNVPPEVRGKVFFITASLSDFLNKLQARATTLGAEAHDQVREAIGLLLRLQLGPEDFVEKMKTAIKGTPPPNLLEKLKTELANSSLSKEGNAEAAVGAQPEAAVGAQPEAAVGAQPEEESIPMLGCETDK